MVPASPFESTSSVEEEVAALFGRVERDHERLDVLANVITGQPASWKNFLDESPGDGRAHVESWIWPHVTTAWHAAKLMVKRRSGLIVELIEQEGIGFHGAFAFDLMETLLKRLIFGLANELGGRGVSAVAIGPGFMRTEAILEGFGVTEANWRDALTKASARRAWDGEARRRRASSAVPSRRWLPIRMCPRKNGGIYTAWALSEEYGFTDVDGTRPDRAVFNAAVEEAKKTYLAPLMAASRFTGVDWQIVSKSEVGQV